MPRWSELPTELVVAIVKRAALDETHEDTAWVASLRLISRALRKVVTPILFEILVVTVKNVQSLAQLAPAADSPLLFVRSLIVGWLWDDTIRIRNAYDGLIGAVRNVRSFTGDIENFQQLARRQPSLRFSSVCLSSRGSTLAAPEDLQELVDQLTAIPRLHFLPTIYSTGGDREARTLFQDYLPPRMRTQYIIIDVPAHANPRLQIEALPQLLRVPTMEHILVRFEDSSELLVHRGSLEAMRDERVWLAVGETSYSRDLNHVTGLSDALIGDELWLSGEQVYFAPTL